LAGGQRAAAERLLQNSAAARARWAAARGLDAVLDAAAPTVAPEIVDRVVDRARAAVRFLPQDKAADQEPLLPGLPAATARWLSAGVLSGAVAAGLAFGFVLQPAPNSTAVAAAAEEAETNTAVSLVFARPMALDAEAE